MLTDVIDSEDIRVIESCSSASFLFEALHVARIEGERMEQDFDGDPAMKPAVLSAIHLSHAACANERDDLVGSQPCARNELKALKDPGTFQELSPTLLVTGYQGLHFSKQLGVFGTCSFQVGSAFSPCQWER
jgi:hypothetical protein